MLQADNSCQKLTFHFSNPKTNPYIINTYTKFGENPLIFTSSSRHKIQMDVQQMDRHMYWVYVAIVGADGSFVTTVSNTSPKN